MRTDQCLTKQKNKLRKLLIYLAALVMSTGYSLAQFSDCTSTDKIVNGTFTGNAAGWNITGPGWEYNSNLMYGNGNLSIPAQGNPITSILSQNWGTPLSPGNYRLNLVFGTQNMSTFSTPGGVHRMASLEIKIGGNTVATITNTNSGGSGLSNDNITISTANGANTNFNLTTTNLTTWVLQNDLYFDIPITVSASDIEFIFSSTGDYMRIDNVVMHVCESDPMPVKLIDFSAKAVENQSELSWSTSEETNSDHFDVQRSYDAKTWQSLGLIASAQKSSSLRRYKFTDAGPLDGPNYYRLKMVDLDGTFAYSQIRTINLEGMPAVTIYPNPVAGKVYLKNIDLSKVTKVSVSSIDGKYVHNYKAITSDGIDVGNITPGVYILSITGRDLAKKSLKLLITK